MLREAGGSLICLNGRFLDDVTYDFDAKYPVIAAATEKLSDIIREKIS